ncbi:MAG TPA: hypothetical protein VKU37_12790 [Verrucomicrobiae bacterium]|nr:hypothetical protein [Verrucomicrobiae bacterium]
MNSAFIRSLIIFGVCVVLAIWLGFLVAGPLTYSSLAVYGLLAFTLTFPIFLRWHYPLMLLCWNFAAVVPFMPGRPSVGLTMILLSLGISVLQRAINRESQFIGVPQITVSLFIMLAVVMVTAKMTGFGIRVFGSSVYGGHKYLYLVGGILGYFALSAKRIPPGRRNLYLGLFFLGSLSAALGDLVGFLPRSLYVIYWFFQPFNLEELHAGVEEQVTRLNGALYASLGIFSFMLARYGIRGIFFSRKPWRWVVLFLAMVYGLLGGYRSLLMIFALLFMIELFLEGLHRTKLMAIIMSGSILVALALIPLAEHLPVGFQRTLSFLPYKVSTQAKLDAQASLDWRLDMWNALVPQIPGYLLLGKGYNINPLDYEFVMGPEASIRSTAENDPLALAEDFHNGPISVLIPFGIWGAIAFLWFIAAGIWVVYRNYRYGDPTLKTINSLLLAAFATRVIMFFFVGGDLSTDMMTLCGYLGLNVSFNGGVARRVHAVGPAPQPKPVRSFARIPSAPLPAYQRPRPGTVQ